MFLLPIFFNSVEVLRQMDNKNTFFTTDFLNLVPLITWKLFSCFFNELGWEIEREIGLIFSHN
jgi:hypothetical protein